jgi:hypothetical protein
MCEPGELGLMYQQCYSFSHAHICPARSCGMCGPAELRLMYIHNYSSRLHSNQVQLPFFRQCTALFPIIFRSRRSCLKIWLPAASPAPISVLLPPSRSLECPSEHPPRVSGVSRAPIREAASRAAQSRPPRQRSIRGCPNTYRPPRAEELTGSKRIFHNRRGR